ncbi:MAG: cadmium-translocating P-type ATPase [Chloroflexi bacterium]|nr:MAG: cadmium-translocating P-type ATPase [Chloroflexota bacterium]
MPGVRRATASYLGGALTVTFDQTQLSDSGLLAALRRIGARVRPLTATTPDGLPASTVAIEFWLAGITLTGMLAGWAAGNWAGPRALMIAAYTAAYLAGGYFGLRASIQALRRGVIEIDLLMVLAAGGAAMVGQPFEGGLLLFLFSLSNAMQSYSFGRTKTAVEALIRLRPTKALVVTPEGTQDMPVEQVAVGAHIRILPGAHVPLDGVVMAGESSVNEASLTGEALPKNKRLNDAVLAGSINIDGTLLVRVARAAADSTLARLIRHVEQAQSEKAPTQRLIDAFEQRYAVLVIAATAALILLPPFVSGTTFQAAFSRAITVMVAASPCALVISTPATILSAIANAARRGVLFKGGAHVEEAARIRAVAIDKTGTLTTGQLRLTKVQVLAHPNAQWTTDQILALAAGVHELSEHPLAQATVRAARAQQISAVAATDFQSVPGRGVRAMVAGVEVQIGNSRYINSSDAAALQAVEAFEQSGHTAVLLKHGGNLLAVLAYADTLRPTAAAAVRQLRQLGVERVIMLTGDNEHVARGIAEQTGVDEYHAGLLPADKMRMLQQLKRQYVKVAMVGDGVNDAPALAASSLGIAMGAAGTDVALETADVVLMADDLLNLPYVIALGRSARRTLLVNLGFALAMIAAMVASIFSLDLKLPYAVVGHEGGSVLVVLNGLRLLGFRPKPATGSAPSGNK